MLTLKKYDTSSLDSISKIEVIAKNIEKSLKNGQKIAVVISPCAHGTNNPVLLGKLIRQEFNSINIKREMDALVSAGDQVSAALLTLALNKLNISAKSYMSWQLGLRATSELQQAEIDAITNIATVKQEIECGVIPVISGFQGVNHQGDL